MGETVSPLVGYLLFLFLNINSFNLPLSKAEMKHNNTRMSSTSKIHLDDNVIIGTPLTFLVYETYSGVHLYFFLVPFIFTFLISHFTSSTVSIK